MSLFIVLDDPVSNSCDTIPPALNLAKASLNPPFVANSAAAALLEGPLTFFLRLSLISLSFPIVIHA
ncbi:hypothetical protein D3C80_2184140 [compost metagenome]